MNDNPCKSHKGKMELKVSYDRNNPLSGIQETAKDFVKNYRIHVYDKSNDFVIVPLWVEAYYYDEEKGIDYGSDGKVRQENNFGGLYFRFTSKEKETYSSNYNRVDLCLSDKDKIHFSLLLKSTLVNGKYKTQSQLANDLLNAFGPDGDYTVEVVKRENPAASVKTEKRINFPPKGHPEEEREKLANKELAFTVDRFTDNTEFCLEPDKEHTKLTKKIK